MSKEDNKNLKNGGEKMLEAMNNIDDKYLAEYDKSVKEGFVIGEKEGFGDNVTPKKNGGIKKALAWSGAAAAVVTGVFVGGQYLAGNLTQKTKTDSSVAMGDTDPGRDSTLTVPVTAKDEKTALYDAPASASSKADTSARDVYPSDEKASLKPDVSDKVNHFAEDIDSPAKPIDSIIDDSGKVSHEIEYEPIPEPAIDPGMPIDDPGEPIVDPIVEPRPDVQAEPFLLTAGRWNDNKNWGFFKNLISTNTIEFPVFDIDPTNRSAVHLLSKEDDSALAGYRVDLVTLDTDERVIWSAVTNAEGYAYLFNSIDDLACTVKVYDPSEQICFDGTDNGIKVIHYSKENEQQQSTGEDVEIKINGTSKTYDKTQVMFILDTTGSMSDELLYLQADFSKIMEDVAVKNIAYSMNFYRDEGDEYVTRTNPFSTNVKELQDLLNAECADGGGDFPEAVHTILDETINSKEWDKDAVKIAFLIFDAPPHYGVEESLKASIASAARQGIHLIPVVSSGSDRETELFGRSLSIMTDGEYVFLTDDSGIGGSHLKPIIGPHDVEKLHDVIVNLIEEYSGVKKAE
ncbi:MAG: VWA domain-containing protein [Lachnospiraceae bacterium]|nr:VWA domain-containing protein [Lachnospiraceae bacterium]